MNTIVKNTSKVMNLDMLAVAYITYSFNCKNYHLYNGNIISINFTY